MPVVYRAEAIGYASSYGEYAPYMMASNRHGVLTQSRGGQLRLSAFHLTDTTKRFSYGFGADFIAGITSATNYQYYDVASQSDRVRGVRPPSVYLQQLFAELKYRCLFVTLGMKEYNSLIVNHSLSSGDLLYSGNTRPIPEIRIGFIDFQNVPFTQGWLQVQTEYSFGRNLDNSWMEKHYNYNGGWFDRICINTFYSYKRFYFRTNPSQPFS
ncbi:MAG: capsule assembly Wzi family protein, partial [Muribaculaceae bacterium]|nr:capsule assembly Wzi family protein [Muribaculaceae bacterium]